MCSDANTSTSPDDPTETAIVPSESADALGAEYPATRPLRALFVECVAVCLLGVVLMHFLQTGAWGPSNAEPGVPVHDSFYHIKMAELLPEHGPLREFPWLRFSFFTEQGHDFVGHHYGFHALLVPFVKASQWITGDSIAGGRWAMAFFFGANLCLFNLLLISWRVPWRWIFLLLFLAMPFQFFTRHAFVRAIAPSLSFMLLLVWLLSARRFVWASLTIIGFVQLYLGSVMYAPMIVAAFVAGSLLGTRHERRQVPKMLLWCVAGWLIGILIHPYAGGIYELLKLQVFGTGLSPDIAVGREWQQYQGLWWFALMAGPVLITWAVGVIARLRTGPTIDASEMALLLISFGFLILTSKARRFVEYWPVFCLLSAATLNTPFVRQMDRFFVRYLPGGRALPWRRVKRGVALLCVGGMWAVAQFSCPWRSANADARCNYNLSAIEKMMAFLKTHSEPGDVIFTDDWDIFPVFFYHNDHNHYIVGLDPKFTHHRMPVLWERYVKVSRGNVTADVSVKTIGDDGREIEEKIHVTIQDIRDHFGARFVITDREHKSLARKLNSAEGFTRVVYPAESYDEVRNDPYLIFEIVDEPGIN